MERNRRKDEGNILWRKHSEAYCELENPRSSKVTECTTTTQTENTTSIKSEVNSNSRMESSKTNIEAVDMKNEPQSFFPSFDGPFLTTCELEDRTSCNCHLENSKTNIEATYVKSESENNTINEPEVRCKSPMDNRTLGYEATPMMTNESVNITSSTESEANSNSRTESSKTNIDAVDMKNEPQSFFPSIDGNVIMTCELERRTTSKSEDCCNCHLENVKTNIEGACAKNESENNTIIETEVRRNSPMDNRTLSHEAAPMMTNESVNITSSAESEVNSNSHTESSKTNIEAVDMKNEPQSFFPSIDGPFIMTCELEPRTTSESEDRCNCHLEISKTNMEAAYVKNESENNTIIEPEVRCNSLMDNRTLGYKAAPMMTNESVNITSSTESEANSNSPMENSKTNIEATYGKNETENNITIEPEDSCNSPMDNRTLSHEAAPMMTNESVNITSSTESEANSNSPMENSKTNIEEAYRKNEPENGTGCCESANSNMKGKALHDQK